MLDYHQIGLLSATFRAGDALKPGDPVSLGTDGSALPAAAGEAPVGVCTILRGGYAGVQLRGGVTLPYSGVLLPGWQQLAADGNGGVTATDDGVFYLVAAVDTIKKEAQLIL